ncbi:MAG: TspO/MBR family protein [Pseudomonadota bacterium]
MDLTVFLVYLAACCAAAATGSLFPPDKWYFEDLKKPGWTPPPWLFPLAWSVLYIASAVAAARVASSADGILPVAVASAFWALQIALNTLWTPVFFGLKRLGAAMIVLSFLWLAVVATMVAFFRVDAVSGLLMVPYLVWVSYAGALNWWIWRRNNDMEPA